MRETHSLRFAPFRLDLGGEQLWRGEEERPRRAKPLRPCAISWRTPGSWSLKTNSLRPWAVPYVSDTALAACIREIRRALDEPAYAPQLVETVRGGAIGSVPSDGRAPPRGGWVRTLCLQWLSARL